VKLLLDECVDRRLAREISGHDVDTVPEKGWAAVKNGELLQDLSRFSLAVVVMRARSNRLSDLQALVPDLLAILPAAKRGEVTWIGI